MLNAKEREENIKLLNKELSLLRSQLQHVNSKLKLIENSKIWRANRQLMDIVLILKSATPFYKKTHKIAFKLLATLYYMSLIIITPITLIINLKKKSKKLQNIQYQNWIKFQELSHFNRNFPVNINDTLTIFILGKPSKSILKTVKKSQYKLNLIEANNSTENIFMIEKSQLDTINTDYILILPENYTLAKKFFSRIFYHINLRPNCSLYYFDEDYLTDEKREKPRFKPDFCPDNLLADNYIGDVFIINKKSIKNQSSTFTSFDILTNILDTKRSNIYHIPEILVHKKNELKKYDRIESIKKHYSQKEQKVDIQELNNKIYIRYKLNSAPKVSIIIPTKDKSDLLKQCVDSIINKSTYKNFEIIIINNSSESKSFYTLINNYKTIYTDLIKIIDYPNQFNYSKIVNFGREKSNGEYLLFLNNDTKIITPNWIELLLENAQRDNIGSVGAKLFYENDKIQHAGVLIGVDGAAVHALNGVDKNNSSYFNILNTTSNYSAVTGACLMCNKNKFDSVNGFDENLAIEFNDIDFCLKLMQKDYYNLYLPNVELYHFESKSRGHSSENSEAEKKHKKELEYFQKKWANTILHDPFLNCNLSKIFNDFRINVST